LTDFYSNKGGVSIPAPQTLTSYVKETEAGIIVDGNNRRLSAGEYVFASISYTNERCHQFFNVLEHFKQDSELIDKVLTAAVAAGGPLVALNASKSAVAAVTSGVSFANQYNQYVADIFAFSAYKDQLMKHVFDAMGSYVNDLNTKKPIFVNVAFNPNASDTLNLMIARSIASDYASL